ncbi:MAG: MFS transporter [Thermoanaerobaculia bacterium]
MSRSKGLRALPRAVWVQCAATFVNRSGTMVLPFLLLYLTRDLGLAPSTGGAIVALYGATALVTSPFAGRLTDRVGPLRLMTASLLMSGLVLLAFPAARTAAAVAVATVLWAVVSELFRPASLTAIASAVGPENRKTAFAVNRLAINLGMSIGPALGGLLATWSYGALFVVDGLTSLAAAAILAKAGRPERTHDAHAGGEAATAAAPAHRDRRLLYLLLGVVPVAVVFFQHVAAMALFLVRDLGWSEAQYGLLATLNTLLVVGFEVPLNSAMAHWPARRTLPLGAVLTGAGFGLLAFAHAPGLVIASVVVWTFGEIVLFPGLNAAVAELAPEARRGEYMGLYMTAFNLAFAIGPWAGTAVLERWGGPTLWTGAFLAGLVSAILLSRTGARPRAAAGGAP